MRRTVPVGLICLLILAAVVVIAFLEPTGASSARLFQDDIPTEGWTVCRIGGLMYIPEVGEVRQIFEICHADGWRYQTYCLQPLLPVPELNTMCSILDNDTVWCGDGVQQQRLYALLDTPVAPETLTPTHTATSTSTSTRTATPTQTATVTSTPTRTGTPTTTRTLPAPPDYPDRPPPGGPGNTEIITLLFGSAGVVTAAWTLRRRRQSVRG